MDNDILGWRPTNRDTAETMKLMGDMLYNPGWATGNQDRIDCFSNPSLGVKFIELLRELRDWDNLLISAGEKLAGLESISHAE